MSSGQIVVVDYHKGNIQSVVRGIEEAGGSACASDNPQTIRNAAAVILPGVGAFEDAMGYLQESGEADALLDVIGAGKPFLGICIGLHLLFERGYERSEATLNNVSSDEEWVSGLGVFKGSATRLESSRLKVPHVGWDQAHLSDLGRTCPLFVDVAEGANLYFTHSYALDDDIDPAFVTTHTHYTRSFASSVWSENVYAVQFHPEKSSATGLRILQNFVNIARG